MIPVPKVGHRAGAPSRQPEMSTARFKSGILFGVGAAAVIAALQALRRQPVPLVVLGLPAQLARR